MDLTSSSSPRARTLRALLGLTAVSLVAAGTTALAAGPSEQPSSDPARTVPFALVEDRDVDDRLASPEDRYAPAGGCYTLAASGQGVVTRTGDGLAVSADPAAAVPLHFQATRLGEYLLATNEGRDTAYDGAWWDVRGYVAATPTAALPVPFGGEVEVAEEPSEAAEWRLVADGPDPETKVRGKGRTQDYLIQRADGSQSLAVQEGALALVEPAAATPFTLRHVPDDDPADDDANGTACATWPEIDTDTVGRPEPVRGNPNQPVQGFFEAHVHGMAFEFLGGELRCGRPWHEYGVEYALGSCDDEKGSLNRALEVPLGGYGPDYTATYDPVGWPTFTSWPKNRTLTHEQYYWRWLERAYLGGLRLTTNLLVDNEALCKLYPVKKNSCNEMDGVRLQAQRLFELQDYIDAQYGGPGEGWLRIVTNPAQARQTIHAGRMALVLGIEISALFDCTELLDVPQCTTEQIDERLQEVFDMGVRQMELVNKFDNALSGVTGDPGSTGIVVNNGNRDVTGHWWDMQTCEQEAEHEHEHGRDEVGDEHDKTQVSPTDATPGGGEGIDALAGRVLDQFGGATKRAVAPLYGPGPHCNSRGLTDLGEHLIRAMVDKGMMFDPDHMSASAQRAALDLLEQEIAPAERAAAAEEGRAARLPAVLSSHSWGNEVVYQRIYEQNGVVAPYAGDSASFVDRWRTLRGYAAAQAPEGYDFGMGYGADTNGLGGQPPARPDGTTAVDYSQGFAAPIGGVVLQQQSSGLRTFDLNTEGVSQYGMFADWFHDVTLAADDVEPGLGAQIQADMLNGAETYLSMWERGVYGGNDCVADGSMLQVNDLHAALGLNLDGFLQAIGQPVDREGAAYVYCAETEDGAPVVVDVVFGPDGRAAEVVPTAGDVTLLDSTHDHAKHDHPDLLDQPRVSAAPATSG